MILAGGGGEDAIPRNLDALVQQNAPEIAVVAAEPDHRLAALCIRQGSKAFFALPGDLEILRSWLQQRVDRAAAREHAAELAQEGRARYDFSTLMGASAELEEALNRASRVIPSGRVTVLLTGETGTGKELMAQAIHYNGPRAAEPFIPVNCAALPPTLLEAELFGYEKGAFTDARTSKPGLFEAAHLGTLFLDEIGEVPLEVQAKLLSALETRSIRRLGSTRTVDVDIRLIAATNLDLLAAVNDGRFRPDLYYRLSVVPIRLPALRDRGDDVRLLAEHFLHRFSEEHGVQAPELGKAALQTIREHSWPGNVRELRNAVERAVLLGGGVIHANDLVLQRQGADHGDGRIPFPSTIAEMERAAARATVDLYEGNKSLAAKRLGISRARLYRLLRPSE